VLIFTFLPNLNKSHIKHIQKNNRMKNKELFDALMEKLEVLILRWEKHHKGKPLSHFDGIYEMYYIETSILRDSVDVLKQIYGTIPSSASSIESKVRGLRFEYNEIDDIYSEYLMDVPQPLLRIFYLVEAVFGEYNKATEAFNEERTLNFIKRADGLLEKKD